MELVHRGDNVTTVSRNGNTYSRTENNGKVAWFIFAANGDNLMLDFVAVGTKLEKEFKKLA